MFKDIPPFIKKAGLIISGFAIYYLMARLGQEFAVINKQASPIWPATGVGISLCLLFGSRMVFSIFFGALLAGLNFDLDWKAALPISLGSAFEAYFTIWYFKKINQKGEPFGGYTEIFYALISMGIATSVSAVLGTLGLWWTSIISPQMIPMNWLTWWIGNLLGALLITPIVYLYRVEGVRFFLFPVKQIPRALLAIFVVMLTCTMIFYTEAGKPYLFAIFGAILVAAYWVPQAWYYILSLVIAIFSIHQTVSGHGPYANHSFGESLVHLQVFLVGFGVTSLGLGGLRRNGFNKRIVNALLTGWILSGLTFYFLYTSTAKRDESRISDRIKRSKEVVAQHVNNYVDTLKSAESFIISSEFVSETEWQSFSENLLESNRYPGIDALGILYPGDILKKIPSPGIKAILNSPDELFFSHVYDYANIVHDHFEGRRLKPGSDLHLQVMKSKKTLQPTLTAATEFEDQLFESKHFYIISPIFSKMKKDNSNERIFLGAVFALVDIKKFLKSAITLGASDLSIKVALYDDSGREFESFVSDDWQSSYGDLKTEMISIVDKTMQISWRRSARFENGLSLISTWAAFFGTFFSLFLASMFAVLQNVSEQAKTLAKSMTQEIEERKRAWQALTETSPVGILVFGRDGNCRYVNPAWSRITGIVAEKAAGIGWMKAIHPEDLARFTCNWSRLINREKFVCNYRFVKPDGSIVYINGHATLLENEKGEISGYVATAQDITELHLNQIALLTASRMSSLGEMASGIAHEINNPLTIIQGRAQYLEMILSQPQLDMQKIRQSTNIIHSTVQRIAKIIRGLQAFARESTADPFSEASLGLAVEDALELCRERFSKNKMQLLVPNEIDRDMTFWGRHEQISQVILNLLNNAFDATARQQDRWVKIEIKKVNHHALITISDSGNGIEPHLQSRLFDPFFTTKEVGKGTGLGLSISRGIMERHKGRLYLDTAKSNTTFVIELPLMKEASGSTALRDA